MDYSGVEPESKAHTMDKRRHCSSAWGITFLAAALFPTLSSNRALAQNSMSLRAGLGVAVQSDNNYSPMVDTTLTVGRWGINANVSGYSESQTKVTHLLSGVLYGLPLTSGGALKAEFGIGALMAQTSAAGKTERMFASSFPIGLDWTIFNLSDLAVSASWKSWLFATHPYVPFVILLAHDRFSTVSLSAGFAL